MSALAGPGREVVVSRGQLVEIGGGFRMPEVIAQAGARLVEVGTTNRTRLGDYAAAIGPDTGAILRAHPSNFRAVGFVEEVEIEALCGLGVPVIDDVGSGVLADDVEALAGEPPVRRRCGAGAALVAFSGDKLLGGPQAGVLVGHRGGDRARAGAIRSRAPCGSTSCRSRRSRRRSRSTATPRSRAASCRCWRMLTRRRGARAPGPARLAAADRRRGDRGDGRVGGGALPLLELPGPAVALDPGPAGAGRASRALRAGDPAVVGAHRARARAAGPAHARADELDAVAAAVAAARG